MGVIIPTFNRSDTLLLCLEHLERQTRSDFEVLVVDDGSTDATRERMEEYAQRSPLHMRYIRQENSGPARARNVAIALLKAPVCLMIGDDILASPDFVSAHIELHQRRPEQEVAGLGLTRWSETGQTVTKFMRWLDESGVQFAYGQLLAGEHPDWKHFYTSNLSVKTELLRRFPFNERFTKAATEDIELGYRIEAENGLELVFLPHATAEHLHPTSFRQACRRMIGVGASTRLFDEIWPAPKSPKPSRFRRWGRDILLRNEWLLPPVTTLADRLTKTWCPNPVMRFALDFHRGYGYWNSEKDTASRKKIAGPLPAAGGKD